MDDRITIISEKELTKVKNNILNTQQLGFMFSKTPEAHIYKRPAKGGGEWKYVTGTYVKKVLNMMFGWDWDFEVVEFKYDLEIKQVFVLGKLTCRAEGRQIVKMQFGRKDIILKRDTKIPLDLGNDLKAATTDALKKCASELGIAADVYSPNEFKSIRVVADGGERIKVLKKKISELLEFNQDVKEKQGLIDMMLEKEEVGEASIEFYENMIADQLQKRV